MTKSFASSIVARGTKARIPVPFDPNKEWGKKDRHYITGTVGGCKVRGPLESESGQYFLSLGEAWLRDNPIDTGRPIEVVLSPEGPQLDTVAPDITAALASDPNARTFFESLATFYRKGYINWIEEAKRPETRASRIAQMMDSLKSRRKQR